MSEERTDLRDEILEEFYVERDRQDDKWGAGRDIPSIDMGLAQHDRRSMVEMTAAIMHAYGLPTEADAKARCELAMAEHRCTHAHIVIEELCEVMEACIEEGDDAAEREQVQLGACVVQWLEHIRARKRKAKTSKT